jgi:hypothetical protein
MSLGELEEIAVRIRDLRRQGRAKRDAQLQAEREMLEGQREALVDAAGGGKPPQLIKNLGTAEARKEFKTPKLKQLWLGTLKVNRWADILDGGKPGPYIRWLWDELNTATDAQLNAVHGIMDEQQAKLKELGIAANLLGKREQFPGRQYTHEEMIGVYIYSQFEKGMFSLLTDNRIPRDTITKIISSLSKEEKTYGDWMIDTLSRTEDFDRLSSALLGFNNTRMMREERYFPFQRRDLSGDAFLADIARQILEDRGLPRRRGAPGFVRTRLDRYPGQEFPPLRLSAAAIFADHIEKREWFIANAVLVKRLNRLFGQGRGGGNLVRNAILQGHGDALLQLVDRQVGAYENPNIYRAIDDWGALGRMMRTNVTGAMIGYNFLTILRQLPDIPQIMVQAGPLDAIGAAARLIASPRETMAMIHEKAPQLRSRSYDRFTEELKLMDRNAYERFMRKAGQLGFLALQTIDSVTNAIGWLAVYNRTMRETGNDIAASKAAQDFVLRVRPAARAKDLAQFYRDPGIASWFLMWTSQQNAQWNILAYDIPKMIGEGFHGDTKQFIDAAVQGIALMVGAVGMAMVARKRLPEGWEWLRDILANLGGNVPFVGYDIEAAVRGQGNWGALTPFEGAYTVARAAIALGEGDMEKAAKAAMAALWDLGRASALPIVQAKRFYKAIDSGDPWDLIGGAPKAAGE